MKINRLNFEDQALILIPFEGDGSTRWVIAEECRWDCPKDMLAVDGLQSWYASVIEETPLKDTIMHFMKDIIGISDLTSDDIVEELSLQKASDSPDGDMISQMYERLAGMVGKLSTAKLNALK